jgi:DNA-binding transcriptional LysR family regulator
MRAGASPIEPDLEDLALLAALARTGSFTRAAAILRINKSSASRRLGMLEVRIGRRLFERTTRQVRPTDAALPLLRRATRLLDEARVLTQELGALSTEPTGQLRVTTTDVIAQTLAVPVGLEYLRRYPWMQLRLVATQERLDLLGDDVDLALRIGPLPDSSQTSRSFGAITTGLFAAPTLVGRHPTVQRPADLHRLPAVLTLEGGALRPWILTHGAQRVQVTPQPTVVVNSVLLARDATLAGAGVSRLPTFLVRAAVEQGALVPVLARWKAGDRAFHALFAHGRRPAPKVRAFLDLLIPAARL